MRPSLLVHNRPRQMWFLPFIESHFPKFHFIYAVRDVRDLLNSHTSFTEHDKYWVKSFFSGKGEVCDVFFAMNVTTRHHQSTTKHHTFCVESSLSQKHMMAALSMLELLKCGYVSLTRSFNLVPPSRQMTLNALLLGRGST